MTKIYPFLRTLFVASFVLAIASIAQAQATRTWVSGVGDDVNPCSRTAPCKTWAGAISKTAAGGEIDALDPGGFGAVTITKSMLLDGTHGAGFGSTLASGVNGVNVNDSASGSPQSIVVRLRNLSINGAGTTLGLNGVNATSFRKLYVEDCYITNFSNAGVNINITAGSGTFNVSVTGTIIDNVTGSGIKQNTTVGTLNCHYDNVVLQGNGKGLEALGGTGNISNSVITHNATDGVSVNNGAVVNASSNQVTNNANGFNIVSGTIRLGNNSIFRNTSNAFSGAGYVTFGNNNVAGNNGNEALPAATAPK